MILLAHHVEPEHYPILAVFFCVGIWLGWQLMSLALQWFWPIAAPESDPIPFSRDR